jgi:renalase
MAHLLTEAGHTVRLFDKSRGLGGRLCHRRSEHGRFLHGLQFAHIRSEKVQDLLQPWLSDPHSTPLDSVGYCSTGQQWTNAHDANRVRFFPETSTICKHWVQDTAVHLQTRVTHIAQLDTGWIVYSGDEEWRCDQLVLSIPYTQLLELLPEPCRSSVKASIAVKETPACSVMLRFVDPIHLPHNFEHAFVQNSDAAPIRWISKQPSCVHGRHWTCVLDGVWTDTHWKTPSESVLNKLSGPLEQIFNQPIPSIEWSNVHWWKYAFSQSIRCTQQYFSALNLTIIGDGTSQHRGIEGAILSADEGFASQNS